MSVGPLTRLVGMYPALAKGDFRLLWLGTLPSNLAWWVGTVAIGYAAFNLSGTATTLGWVSLAAGVPMLVFPLVGGVVADRLPRRRVLLTTQSCFCVATLLLAAAALLGWLAVWQLLVYGVVQGILVSFNVPSRQAYIAELVGPELLRSAVAVNNAGINFARVAGPSLAGLLLAAPAIGVGGAFLAMTLMYAVVLASLLQLPATPLAPARKAARRGGWSEFVEGLGYIAGSPVLLALLSLALVPQFFGMPYLQLMPVFAERVFDVGAAGLGTLMAASGIGSLVGAVTIAALAGHPRPALLQLACGVAFGLALVAFGLAPHYLLALGCLFVAGLASAAYTTLNNTLVLSNSEPRLHGRVMSVYVLTYSAFPLGSLPAGWLADHLGSRATVVLDGLIVGLVVVGVATLYPRYRHIQ